MAKFVIREIPINQDNECFLLLAVPVIDITIQFDAFVFAAVVVVVLLGQSIQTQFHIDYVIFVVTQCE